MSRAVKMCPDLIIVPAHHREYEATSEQVMARLHNVTPMVEQISIDEAFMDVTGLRETGEILARNLQVLINTELGLPCSFGVASNKLVAKIANNVGKSQAQGDVPPNAIQVVPPGEEAAFLAPLPIRELWGVGPKTAERLAKLGARTIGDLARRPESELVRLFGKIGAEMAQHARGIDTRPVETEHETRSVSKETTFTRDIKDAETLRRTLRKLSDGVGFRLRQSNLSGSTIKIKLRWADFTTLTRQLTLDHPTNRDDEIYQAAVQLFEQAWPRGRPVRLVGVGVSGFDAPGAQLGLWDSPVSEEDHGLQSALDKLRSRFGESIIQRGSDLKDDEL
jgi:DNA polymerase-4